MSTNPFDVDNDLPSDSTKKKNAENLKLVPGDNYIRFYPEIDNETIAVAPFYHSYLEVLKDEWVDGNKTDKKVLKNSPIFSSNVHFGTKYDMVDSYLKAIYYEVIPSNNLVKDDVKKFIGGLKGLRVNKQMCLYAALTDEKGTPKPKGKGMLALTKGTWDAIKSMFMSKAKNDKKLAYQMMFSKQNGLLVKIFVNPDDPSNYYTVSLASEMNADGTGEVFVKVPLTDKDVEFFNNFASLKDRFVKSYDVGRDYPFQLEGLNNFDYKFKTKFGVSVLDSQVFKTDLEVIQGELGIESNNNDVFVPEQTIPDSNEISDKPQNLDELDELMKGIE